MVKEEQPPLNKRAGRKTEVSHTGSHELLWRARKPDSNISLSHRDMQKLATRTKAEKSESRQVHLE